MTSFLTKLERAYITLPLVKYLQICFLHAMVKKTYLGIYAIIQHRNGKTIQKKKQGGPI